MKIFPSLISADLLNLEPQIRDLNSHCDGYHIDVMDNHFVRNLTWGAGFIHAISRVTNLPLHIHLMVDDPICWIDCLSLRENDVFIFHYESVCTIEKVRSIVAMLSDKGVKVGLALNPSSAIETVASVLGVLDVVLLMSVEPGFSGQKFIESTTHKIKPLVAMRENNDVAFSIAMDGGINEDNIHHLHAAGVDYFAMASALFGAGEDPKVVLARLKKSS